MDSPTNEDQDPKLEDSSASEVMDTDNTEDSSDSKTSEPETSTYDVVMNAINPEADKKDESESNSEDEDKSDKEETEGETEDDTGKEISEDDFEDLSPEARKHLKKETGERFDKLKGLYRVSKDQVTDLTTQLEQSEVGAGHYRQFNSFLETNRISSDEANELFSIGAHMKNDPAKALELLAPHYNNLLRVTGNILPADLKQQVDEGYITKQNALELSRSRANGQSTQAIKQDQQDQQETQLVNQQQEQFNTITSAISGWEKQWSSSDLDYSVKKERVLDGVELALTRAQKNGNMPKTAQEAIELANNVKTQVEAELRSHRPKKPIDTVNGGKSSNSVPDAKTTLDVVRRALN